MLTKKAQNISEYTILIGLIGAVLLMMNLYFKRGVQVVVKEPIDGLGGFGSGMFSPEEIQEIGIESGVAADYAWTAIPSRSQSTVNNAQTITTTAGGQRRTDINNNTDDSQESRSYNKIKFDQVTRPNTPEHRY